MSSIFLVSLLTYLDTFFHAVDLQSTYTIREWVDLEIKWWRPSFSFLEIKHEKLCWN